MTGATSVKAPDVQPTRDCPVVVVRGELNGLGVVRSLARVGLRAHVVDEHMARPAMWSRGVRRVLTPSLYGQPLVDVLIGLAKRLDAKPVLILTDEAAVMTVAQHRAELSNWYRFAGNPLDIVHRFENKARFHEFARDAGLPVPRGVVISQRGDLSRLKELSGPVIIKPADKMLVYLGRSERLYRADSIEAASSLCASLVETVGELVVQQWIPGPDSNITFCLFYQGAGDDDFRGFVGRKLLANPPQVGSTAVCVAAPELEEQLSSLTRNYIRKSGYRGLGSVEFKFDGRDGQPYIIEPTVGRTDWQEEIATLSGVNLPAFAFELEANQHLRKRPHGTKPIAWRASLDGRSLSASEIGVAKVYDGYWRLLDPLPAIVHYAMSLTRWVRPASRAIRRWILNRITPASLRSAEDVAD